MDLCQSKPCNPLALRTPWALDSCQRTPSVSLNMDPRQCTQYNPRPALRIPWAMDLCRRTRLGLPSHEHPDESSSSMRMCCMKQSSTLGNLSPVLDESSTVTIQNAGSELGNDAMSARPGSTGLLQGPGAAPCIEATLPLRLKDETVEISDKVDFLCYGAMSAQPRDIGLVPQSKAAPCLFMDSSLGQQEVGAAESEHHCQTGSRLPAASVRTCPTPVNDTSGGLQPHQATPPCRTWTTLAGRCAPPRQTWDLSWRCR